MDELDKLILEDLQNHIPWAVIAKNRHTSPNHIAEVKRKYLGAQSSINEDEIGARAFKLFDMGKDAIQATIELGNPQLMKELYDTYLEMKQSSKKLNDDWKRQLDDQYNKGYSAGYDAKAAEEWLSEKPYDFTLPCRVCGLPFLGKLTEEDWEQKVKPWLYENFDICHERCRRL